MAEPIFVYRGMRTGGTALVDALMRVPRLHVLYDPLHPFLMQPFSEIEVLGSGDWKSGHPEGVRYFESFRAFVEGDTVKHFDPSFPSIMRLDAEDANPELERYFSMLIDEIASADRVPVLGFEQAERLIPWFRRVFPSAQHVGLLRSPDATLESWLQQYAIGARSFVDAAVVRVQKDPAFYGVMDPIPSELALADEIEIARRYLTTTNDLRRTSTDTSIDITALRDPGATAEQALLFQALGLTDDERDAVLERIQSSRPPHARLDSLVDVLAYEHTLHARIDQQEQTIVDLHERLALADREARANEQLLRAHIADLTDQLERSHAHTTELEQRYAEAVQYSERPRLALRVLRTKSGAAVRARLRRHRPS